MTGSLGSVLRKLKWQVMGDTIIGGFHEGRYNLEQYGGLPTSTKPITRHNYLLCFFREQCAQLIKHIYKQIMH